MARALMLLVIVTLLGCKRTSAHGDGSRTDGSTYLPIEWAQIEANRNADAIPQASLRSNSVDERRSAVRAVARVGDAARIDLLLGALHDPDGDVVAFAAHGLAALCRTRPDEVTRALVTRLATLRSDPSSVLRALGQCDTPEAEITLAAQLASHCDAAAFALGDIANRKSVLATDTHAALTASPCATHAALYPYARMKVGANVPAAKSLATRALNEASESRIWAIAALGRAGETAPLNSIVTSTAYNMNERVEAAKHVGEHAPAQADDDLVGLSTEVSPKTFHILTTLLRGKAHHPSKAASRALFAIVTQAKRLAETSGKTAHRWQRLSCDAAQALAQGDPEAAVLKQCAPNTTLAWSKARLAAFLSRSVRPSRIPDFLALCDSPHVVIREDTIEGLAAHPELASIAPDVIARALQSKHVGLVAVAAAAIHRQPRLVLEANGRLAPQVEAGMNAALSHPWASDATETATALLDAATSLSLPSKPEFEAKWACHPAEFVRAKIGRKKSCESASYPYRAPTKSHFRIRSTAGDLSLSLDTKRAPIATARFEELARTGFFDGTKVHRLVPGFVAQFGDPQSRENDGDGYGGSGTTMPCETSPIAFAAFDVGVAIAGRDTGSSQFFVTLARTPRLDGAYSWIGKATGPWDEVVEGDVIESVTAED